MTGTTAACFARNDDGPPSRERRLGVCDAAPSYVEAHRDYFVGMIGRYCPWSARLVALADYR